MGIQHWLHKTQRLQTKFFSSLFPLIFLYNQIESRPKLNFGCFKFTFWHLKPENFVFHLMQIESFDIWDLVLSSPFFCYCFASKWGNFGKAIFESCVMMEGWKVILSIFFPKTPQIFLSSLWNALEWPCLNSWA